MPITGTQLIGSPVSGDTRTLSARQPRFGSAAGTSVTRVSRLPVGELVLVGVTVRSKDAMGSPKRLTTPSTLSTYSTPGVMSSTGSTVRALPLASSTAGTN